MIYDHSQTVMELRSADLRLCCAVRLCCVAEKKIFCRLVDAIQSTISLFYLQITCSTIITIDHSIISIQVIQIPNKLWNINTAHSNNTK